MSGKPAGARVAARCGIMAECVTMLLPTALDSPRFASSFVRGLRRVCVGLVICAISALGYAAIAPVRPSFRPADEGANAKTSRGVEIADHGGYPELRVDGAPFFIHSAAFFYYRMPQDQWEPMLERYRRLGINTIDIYIPWNWHEPKEGEIDFDGHTNPRRNLRALLALVAQKRFRLIARPGPEILNEWRHGGYPGWLLDRPEYGMNTIDWLEGRYSPLDGLNARDAEAAARGWLGNATHMTQTRAWLAAVAKELAPYSSHRMVHSPSDDPEAPPREASGPLLFVQLGDDFAIGRTNRAGPDFWRYTGDLREMLEAGGVDVPVFINPTDMRVSAAGSGLERPIGVMGQWYMPPRGETGPTGRTLDASDARDIEFYTEELKTQPFFPPVVIEYQAGWYTPGDDDRPPFSPPENTLLSSRLLIGNGIHGFSYFPLQDTYTPGGYSVPWASRSYRWDAALDPDGDPQPRLLAVRRNSYLLGHWGPQLAASHKRADFGIVYPMGAYPQDILAAPDILGVSESVMRLQRLATLAMLSSELRDPEHQPVDQLLRDPLLLLPVPDQGKPQFQLSDRAQEVLVEYVRRGGTLAVFPARPEGKILEELWKQAPASSEPEEGSPIRGRWKFGEGEVIESTKDLISWIALDRSLSENRAQAEADWSMGAIRQFMSAEGLRPTIEISGYPKGAKDLITTEIVTNEGTGLLGDRETGQGFLSVTNLAKYETADVDINVLSPSAPARRTRGIYVALHAVVPPRESLLLPIEEPLCSEGTANTPCTDAVESSSAELVRAVRDGKVLKLTFYVPASSTTLLHLAQHPSHVTLEELTTPEAHWTAENNELDVTIPRGAAPTFLRELSIDLPYTPHVPEIEKPGKPTPNEFDYSVWNALRLPVSATTFLRTYPPLVVVNSDQPAAVLFSAINHNSKLPRIGDISISGPLHGSDTFNVPQEHDSVAKVSLKPSGAEALALPPDADGLLHGTIKVRSGRDQQIIPIAFLQLQKDGISHYRFDFDRDGADEWVLENSHLRLIVSPASGGRAIALADKSNGSNLITSVGLLRDAFSYTENPIGGNPLRARGRYGLFDRSYTAQWFGEKASPGLKLQEEARDVFPSGASIEKSIQFDDSDTLQVQYHVTLQPFAGAAATPPDLPQQSFVAVNSFPATAPPSDTTRFCWKPQKAPTKPADVEAPPTAEDANQTCEDFVPGGKSVEVPPDVPSVSIQTTGRPVMEISWDCNETCPRMVIEPKNFSALFRLQFAPLAPGADAHYTVRIRALSPP
jgi:hypothetical protein